MAEKSGSDQSNAELRRRISASRAEVARNVGGLQYELNFPLKIKKSFQRNTVFWVGSALALGLLVALLRARTQKVYLGGIGKKVGGNKSLLEGGLILSAIKLAGPLLQPVVMGYFAKKMAKRGAPPPRN
ncbi:MAG: hypothetical protein H0X40_16015 [Chthoniobacterales bacterium]|nr:hypothetical protein [Chthoniobacterales bacterium]